MTKILRKLTPKAVRARPPVIPFTSPISLLRVGHITQDNQPLLPGIFKF